MGQRFSEVGGDAVRKRASHNVGDFITQFNGHLLCYAVGSYDGDVCVGSNKGQSVQFALSQFAVFHLDDVLGAHFL